MDRRKVDQILAGSGSGSAYLPLTDCGEAEVIIIMILH